jgi:ribose transport system permease protein
MSTRLRSRPSSAVTSFVVASRYLPVYIAIGILVVVAAVWAPATLGSVPMRAIAPLAAVLAITALGQMLVVMTGGIDLSVPGTMSLAAVIMVGVGKQSDDRIVAAILIALGVAAIVGLVNGILIGGLKLNPLIVTLAVGQIAAGAVFRYGRHFPVQNPVPVGWSDWATTRVFGISAVFWIGVALTIVVSLGLRYTSVGRRFQAVGANPVASYAVGVRVTLYQILAYVVAAVFHAAAGLALAGLIRRPGAFVGTQYLLAPIAAVVIGGASLTGGAGQRALDVRRGRLPDGPEPDDADHGPVHRAAVRGVRPGDHRRHVGVGRPDHPGGRVRASTAKGIGSRGDSGTARRR